MVVLSLPMVEGILSLAIKEKPLLNHYAPSQQKQCGVDT
jgi:hypothetical protein